MVTSNKDFKGLSTSSHPRRYYLTHNDDKPVDGVINGAECIEVDTGDGFRFDAETKTWYSATIK